jgi:hypothetical protein
MAGFEQTLRTMTAATIDQAKEASKITNQWMAFYEAKFYHDVVKDEHSQTGVQVAVAPAVPFPINLSVGENLQINRSLHDTSNLRAGLYMWGEKTPVIFPPDPNNPANPTNPGGPPDPGSIPVTPDPTGPPTQFPAAALPPLHGLPKRGGQ